MLFKNFIKSIEKNNELVFDNTISLDDNHIYLSEHDLENIPYNKIVTIIDKYENKIQNIRFISKYLSLQDGLLILILVKILMKTDKNAKKFYDELLCYKTINHFSTIDFNTFEYEILDDCDKNRVLPENLLDLIKYTSYILCTNTENKGTNIDKFYINDENDYIIPGNYNPMEVYVIENNDKTILETRLFEEELDNSNYVRIETDKNEKNIIFMLIILMIYPIKSQEDADEILDFVNQKSEFSTFVIKTITKFYGELIRKDMIFKLKYQNILLKTNYKW